jgi:hypothetical protein
MPEHASYATTLETAANIARGTIGCLMRAGCRFSAHQRGLEMLSQRSRQPKDAPSRDGRREESGKWCEATPATGLHTISSSIRRENGVGLTNWPISGLHHSDKFNSAGR